MSVHTLTFAGAIPTKKNGKRAWRGHVVIDPAIKARVEALEWEARSQWAGKPPLECAGFELVVLGKSARGDLDGMATTILDVLVNAGVLRDDNVLCVPAQAARWWRANEDEAERATVGLIEQPAPVRRRRKA